ncbi:ead/Ea22-like family protein [Salmonella enterica]|nr:ead/Ea22-like family protein [Salmonella enterica subsp. enterica]ELD2883387.1 ead/Ea22-like family protein [Salmonella enterica]ELE9879996.1 ead/Ea22-like family protein [Salmonella enterica]
MTIDKQALRQKAVKAGGEEWQSRKMPGPAGEYTVIVKGSLEKHLGWTTCRPVADEVIDKKTMDFIAAANPATMLALLDELEAAEKRIAELDSCTVTVKLPNGDRDIAAFRIDPTEGPSWLTFRCEEDLRENGVIGEFDSVVPLSVITSDVPKRGEVVVTVSGLTGSGKSAIAGEIEIAMRAIGVPVHWMNGGAEKRMTGADWLTAIEMYKPTVRIVEVNVPRAAGIGKGK